MASLATKLVEYVLESTELLRDRHGRSYMRAPIAEHHELFALNTRAARSYLSRLAYERETVAARSNIISDALTAIHGAALYDPASLEVDVRLRVAGHDGMIAIDLADASWRCVAVTRDGWRIEPHGQRYFRRAPGMLPLPEPVHDANLVELRNFVRIEDGDYPLLLAYLVNAVRFRGPYPILLLTGEQGSAKTTTARILRQLIDPNKADVRAEPRENRDLAIAANNGHMVVLDNLSHLSPQMSDALSRLSTGAGFSTRTLYTDEEETIFDGQRPIILTSIVDVASRADLLDRCLSVRLQPIPESERRTEEELWRKFSAVHERLFGALLDAVSIALRNVNKVDSTVRLKPRMADAFTWALAAAPGLGSEATLITEAWNRTRDEAYAATIESSMIAAPLLQLISDGGGKWTGTASEMHARIETLIDDATKRRKEWPKSPKALASQVRVIAPALRASGIDHAEDRRAGTGARLHLFTVTKEWGTDASHASHGLSDEREFRAASASSVTQAAPSSCSSATTKRPDDVGRDDCDDELRPFSPVHTNLAGGDDVLAV
jgi:ABC-type oligopeptide transport system ATPase subunit